MASNNTLQCKVCFNKLDPGDKRCCKCNSYNPEWTGGRSRNRSTASVTEESKAGSSESVQSSHQTVLSSRRQTPVPDQEHGKRYEQTSNPTNAIPNSKQPCSPDFGPTPRLVKYPGTYDANEKDSTVCFSKVCLSSSEDRIMSNLVRKFADTPTKKSVSQRDSALTDNVQINQKRIPPAIPPKPTKNLPNKRPLIPTTNVHTVDEAVQESSATTDSSRNHQEPSRTKRDSEFLGKIDKPMSGSQTALPSKTNKSTVIPKLDPNRLERKSPGTTIPSPTTILDFTPQPILTKQDPTPVKIFPNYDLIPVSSSKTTPTVILKELGMSKYYREGLSSMDVLTIGIARESTSECINVIKRLLKLDYRASVAICEAGGCGGLSEEDDSDQNFVSFMSSVNQNPTSSVFHPMDVMNVIFNCCNAMLLQMLMNRLFICQLSIPLVFPDTQRNVSTCLLWSLREIIPECSIDENKQRLSSLVDTPHRIVSFMRIGELQKSKSKLLNDLLRQSRHDTFFHRDCKNGKEKRKLSNGTIEAAWFQPSSTKKVKLSKLTCFLNLRGEATNYLEHAKLLCDISAFVVLLMDVNSLNYKTFERFVNVCKQSDTTCFLCFVAGSCNNISEMNSSCKRCIDSFKSSGIRLLQSRGNWINGELLNADGWKERVQEVLFKHLEDTTVRGNTLEEIANTFAAASGFHVDESAFSSLKANAEIEKLAELFGRAKTIELKSILLPLQGTHWVKWTQLQREQRRGKIPINELDKFIARKEAEQKEARRQQLQCFQNNSEFTINFARFLQSCESLNEFQYFISKMKLCLDNHSRKVLPRLHKQYHDKWNESQRNPHHSKNDKWHEQINQELNAIQANISVATVGLEHIYREIGQIYEAVVDQSAINQKLSLNVRGLPATMAKLMLTGMPLELMDGDTAFVPVVWLEAVFAEIRKLIGNAKKIYVISVVGIQSSGKSTFLNTMFGLQFAVSAGRCTRGVFCQLIPVEKQSMKVEYDYILVVDTEGLRAPELQGRSRIHDNELATFVIGLGNTTIVNIKGENSSEMNDILEIVVHAMLRIKYLSNVSLNPSCIFVHQNVSAVNAEEKLKFGQESLLMLLDKVTIAAAEEEKIENIHRFKDVINYDEYKHAVYLPDLWQGDPPMAPVNPGYSERVSEIKDMLIEDISRKSLPISIETFASKLMDLWKAILEESFVFNFRNREEVKAYMGLDNMFSELMWRFKDKSQELERNVNIEIDSCKDTQKLKSRLTNEIKSSITAQLKDLEQELNNDFDNHPNKDIVEQWRGRYLKQLNDFHADEQARIAKVLTKNCSRRSLQLQNSTTVEIYRKEVIAKSIRMAEELKSSKQVSDNVDLRKYFDDTIWQPLLDKSNSSLSRGDPKQDVVIAFDHELSQFYNSHMEILKRELERSPLDDLTDHTFDTFPWRIRDDLESKNVIRRKIFIKDPSKTDTELKDMYTSKALNECIDIFSRIRSHVRSLAGEDFHPGQAAHVIQTMKSFFEKIETFGFEFSFDFQIRFMVHVCKCATVELITLRQSFQERTHPLAQLRQYKDAVFQIFENTFKDSENDKKAGEVFAVTFSGWIKETVLIDLSRTFANQIVKTDSEFRNKYSFMRKILIELGERKDFDEFLYYIQNPEEFVNNRIRNHQKALVSTFNRNQHILYNSVESDVRKYVNMIVESVKIFEDSGEQQTEIYSKSLHRMLKRQMVYDTKVLESVKINDFSKFAKYIIGERDSIANTAIDSIKKALDTSSTTVEILTEKMIGCRAKCPFCMSPCCLSEARHAGDHRALQHYPFGVMGMRTSNGNSLCTYNCQSVIKSDILFCYDLKNPQESTKPFKEYRKYIPDWEILPDRSMQSSLYWKWFMMQFHKQLEDYYKLEHTEIPDEWNGITWEEASESLNHFYLRSTDFEMTTYVLEGLEKRY